MHFYIKEIYKKRKKLMKTGESQLQTTFTPGQWLHPGLKVGCIFAARQNALYSRVVATPGTKVGLRFRSPPK